MYALLVASGIIFIYALVKRSWKWMLFSGILVFQAWYISGYPAFPWAIFVPLIQVFFTVLFFATKGRIAK
jgi:hypothetical protein